MLNSYFAFFLPLQLSVHVYNGGKVAESLPTDYTFLAALVPKGTQWATSELPEPINVVIFFSGLDADGAAVVGICHFDYSPQQCNQVLPQPEAISTIVSALPGSRCNLNTACESAFGESHDSCADCH